MIKKIILSIALFSLASSINVYAQENSDFTYAFHLYYDNGQLFPDRDYEFKYDVIAGISIPDQARVKAHKGEIVNFKGDILYTLYFDPRDNNIDFKSGKIEIRAPYFADAKEANFYDAQGNKSATINLAGSSFCDNDGFCEPEYGEDLNTCSTDCFETPAATQASSVNSNNSGFLGGNKTIFWLVPLIAGILIGGYFLARKFLNRRSSDDSKGSSSISNSPSAGRESLNGNQLSGNAPGSVSALDKEILSPSIRSAPPLPKNNIPTPPRPSIDPRPPVSQPQVSQKSSANSSEFQMPPKFVPNNDKNSN